MLLAAEATAGVGRVDADLGERHTERAGDQPLQDVGVLDGTPDGDAVLVGRGHERVRLDREVGCRRGPIDVLDDVVGAGGVHVAPAEIPLDEGVGRAERIVTRPQLRFTDERGGGVQGRGDAQHRGKLLVLDAYQQRTFARGIKGLGDHDGHGLAVEFRLTDCEQGPVGVAGAEAGDRLRQVGGRHHGHHAGHQLRSALVDRSDAGPRAVEMDELDVQRALDPDVGYVALLSGDTLQSTDAARGLTDPRLATDATRTAFRRQGAGNRFASAVRLTHPLDADALVEAADATALQIWL